MSSTQPTLSRRELLFGRAAGSETAAPSAAPSVKPAPTPKSSATASPSGRSQSRTSTRIPDVEVTTHRGTRLRLISDLIRDQRFILGFIYTKCNGICPTTTRNMEASYQLLKSRQTEPFRMISLSIDPERDSAEALQRYAGRYDAAELPDWEFIVASADDTQAIRRALRMTDPDPAVDSDIRAHSGVLLIGNDRVDRWGAIAAGAEPVHIANTFERVARNVTLKEFIHVPVSS